MDARNVEEYIDVASTGCIFGGYCDTKRDADAAGTVRESLSRLNCREAPWRQDHTPRSIKDAPRRLGGGVDGETGEPRRNAGEHRRLQHATLHPRLDMVTTNRRNTVKDVNAWHTKYKDNGATISCTGDERRTAVSGIPRKSIRPRVIMTPLASTKVVISSVSEIRSTTSTNIQPGKWVLSNPRIRTALHNIQTTMMIYFSVAGLQLSFLFISIVCFHTYIKLLTVSWLHKLHLAFGGATSFLMWRGSQGSQLP